MHRDQPLEMNHETGRSTKQTNHRDPLVRQSSDKVPTDPAVKQTLTPRGFE